LSKRIKILSVLAFGVIAFLIFACKPAKASAASFDLIQTPGDGRVFLKENNCKRHIKDYNTFLSFGFNPGMIRQVGRAEFDSYPTAPQLSTVLDYNGRVYAIIAGMKAYVTTGDALTLNGFSWSDLQPFADPTFGMLPDAPPLNAPVYKAVHIPSLGKVYLIENGYRRWIKDWNTWMAFKPFTGDFVNLESARSMVEAPPLSNVLNYNGAVYAIIGGQKAYVTSGAALVMNGFSWGDLQPFADPTFSQMPTAAPLYSPKLISCSGNIYYVAGDVKHHVENWETFLALGGGYTNTAYCDQVATGASMTRLIQAPNGQVFYIEFSQKRYIPDPGTFNGYGFSWGNVRSVDQAVIDSLPTGTTMARWTTSLDGISIPYQYGLTGKEQHLWTTAGETTEAGHYAMNNTPASGEAVILQNGVAGTGAFGKLDAGVEKYYINMRWSYCEWYEDYGTLDSYGYPTTRTRNCNTSLKNWHLGKKIIVSNPRTGRKIVVAIGESGPAIWVTNGRGVVSGMSPEATDYIVGARYGAGGDNLEYGFAVDQSLPLGPLTW
jgi:hypothetical protein